MVATVESLFSPEQMRTLGDYGDERSAAVGDVLFKPGDRIYPLVVILEGEVAILDGADHEIIRHGASSFVGELNLLTGQTVYLTALVTQPLRYIAVERQRLESSCARGAARRCPALRLHRAPREPPTKQSVGIEVLGPRTSESTRALVDYLGRSRIPYVWHDGEAAGGRRLRPELPDSTSGDPRRADPRRHGPAQPEPRGALAGDRNRS